MTNEDTQCIVEHMVRLRLMMASVKKEASGDDLQRVEQMEQGLKVLVEEK